MTHPDGFLAQSSALRQLCARLHRRVVGELKQRLELLCLTVGEDCPHPRLLTDMRLRENPGRMEAMATRQLLRIWKKKHFIELFLSERHNIYVPFIQNLVLQCICNFFLQRKKERKTFYWLSTCRVLAANVQINSRVWIKTGEFCVMKTSRVWVKPLSKGHPLVLLEAYGDWRRRPGVPGIQTASLGEHLGLRWKRHDRWLVSELRGEDALDAEV